MQNTMALPVVGVSFERRTGRLVAGGSGGITVWDLTTENKTFFPCRRNEYIWAFTCDPLGRWLYYAAPGMGWCLFDLEDGHRHLLPGIQDDNHVICLSLNQTGSRLVICRGGRGFNRLECWEVAENGDFSPLWMLRDGRAMPIPEFVSQEPGEWFVSLAALSPDGNTVAVVEPKPGPRFSFQEQHVLRLRDGATGTLRAELGPTSHPLRVNMDFALDGKTLLLWGDCGLLAWDTTVQEPPQALPCSRAYPRGLAHHPSGEFFVTVSFDGQARIWDAKSLKKINAFKWPIGKLHSVDFSPDGTLAVAGGEKGQMVAWDVDF
jgi:WD40 repeat protein